MAVSQFTIFSSGDNGAPRLDYSSGSLIRLLEACLITGYGSKSPVGWLQPIPTLSSSTDGYAACYKQPSGSGMTLFVNDGTPYSASGNWWGNVAYAVGYESLLGLTGSQVGSGSGAFPFPGSGGLGAPQTASVSWIKSKIIDKVHPREWIVFADVYTFYLFIQNSLGNADTWSFYMFGDIYSFKPTRDSYRCTIAGRLQVVDSNNVIYDPGDYVVTAALSGGNYYMPRTVNGTSGSITVLKLGDIGKLAQGADPFKAVEFLLRNLYVGGDDLNIILLNEDALFSCEEPLVKMLEKKTAQLKKN